MPFGSVLGDMLGPSGRVSWEYSLAKMWRESEARCDKMPRASTAFGGGYFFSPHKMASKPCAWVGLVVVWWGEVVASLVVRVCVCGA